MGCRLAIIGVFAALSLVGCDKRPAPDPIDTARLAVQAEFGPNAELQTVAVKSNAEHTVVCGLAGSPPNVVSGGGEYVVVDGVLAKGLLDNAVLSLVNACKAEIPKFDIPPVP